MSADAAGEHDVRRNGGINLDNGSGMVHVALIFTREE